MVLIIAVWTVAAAVVVLIIRSVLAGRAERFQPVSGVMARPANAARRVKYAVNGEEKLAPESSWMLDRVKQFAVAHGEFADAWDAAVNGISDRMTAHVVGARMGGHQPGKIRGEVFMPIPADYDPALVRRAFALAVQDEVKRRVDAMTSPGSFG